MSFLFSLAYILSMSILVFLLGRVFPRKWLCPNSFPFKSYAFEKEGKIYGKLKIMSWKTKLPDASVLIGKIFPRFMPTKRLESEIKIPTLIEETCIAEAAHKLAAILGFGCVAIWEGIGGWVMSLLFLLINVPFVIMQRFNRPRLIKANMMLKRRSVIHSCTLEKGETAVHQIAVS